MIGSEAPPTGRREGEGGVRKGVYRLRDPPRPCLLLYLGRVLLAEGDYFMVVVRNLVTAYKGVGERGSGCLDVGGVLRGSGTGGPVVRFIDVVYVPVN